MVNAVIVHNIVDPKTGLTIKQENLQRKHEIPLDTLVEIDCDYNEAHGCRMFVVDHSRDCDGTPMYGLSYNKSAYFEPYETANLSWDEIDELRRLMAMKRLSINGGWGKEALKVIKPLPFNRETYLKERNCPLVVGKKYRRYDGVTVTIVQNNDDSEPHIKEWPRGYESVQGDDISETTGKGIWRYNRGGNDAGRVCGTAHDMSDPRNLHLEEVVDENEV